MSDSRADHPSWRHYSDERPQITPQAILDFLLPVLLEEASRTSRTVAGCPPAPRLVGIETNPGPRGFGRDAALAVAAEGAAAIGAALAGRKLPRRLALNPSIRPGRKPKQAQRLRALLTGRSRSTAVSLPSMGSSALTVRQPYSQSTVIRNTTPTHSMKQRFATSSMYICTDAAGVAVFAATTSGATGLQIDPNTAISSQYAFGYGMAQLAAVHTRYRVLSLSFEYLPLVPTSATGAIMLAYTPDGGVSQTSTLNLNTISSFDGSTVFPVWARTNIPVMNLDKDWKYCHDSAAASTANERQQNAGVLAALTVVTPGNSLVLGMLRVVGEVEFTGLGATPTLTTASSVDDSSSSAPPKKQITCECKSSYVHVLEPSPVGKL